MCPTSHLEQEMAATAGAREGDWKCDGCSNRNYAFRSFCNRCKQPRLLVDSKTPADSKWLPRMGDWICAGCSNNNYASREKCNKCGEPKEVAALPAMALPGSTMAAPAQHFPTTGPTGLGLGMNQGLAMALHPPFPLGLNWPFGSSGLGGSIHEGGNWRAGDWLCICGYHNYSSRTMCKQCHAPVPNAASITGANSISMQPSMYAEGTGNKRSASNDPLGDLAIKRLKMGADLALHPYVSEPSQSFGTFEGSTGLLPDHGASGVTNLGAAGSSFITPNMGMLPSIQPAVTLVPTILGKGAKHWRSGDWMCTGCDNHNYASRDMCNRCGARKEAVAARLLPVS